MRSGFGQRVREWVCRTFGHRKLEPITAVAGVCHRCHLLLRFDEAAHNTGKDEDV